MSKRKSPSTRSTAVWAKTSGAARSPRSTAVNTAPASTVSAAREALRLRPAAARQAEAEGLLRQHRREAVPQASTTRPTAARATPRENLIGLLERRLDAVVYRAKFVPTLFAARQFVNHGHVLVNGKRVNIPSYRCKAGDVVEVARSRKQHGAGAGSRRSSASATCRITWTSITAHDGAPSCAIPAWPTCRIRCRWNRTSSSNSTAANFRLTNTLKRAACANRRPFLYELNGLNSILEFSAGRDA